MFYFLLFYFGIYGGLHAYVYFKIALPLGLHGGRALALAAFLLLMVLGPMLLRFFEQHHLHVPASALAGLTYTWMAVALWFFFLSLARDLWNLFARAASLALPAASGLAVPGRPYLAMCAGLILLAGIWGFWEARHMRVERVTVTTPFLPAASGPITVAQISDVHFGLIEGKSRLSTVLEIVEREKPDILVSTGDLVDGLVLHLNHLAEELAKVKTPLGKFAVTGNHEYYAGLSESLQFIQDAGFSVLRGRSVVTGGIRIAGVDDPAAREMGRGESFAEEEPLLGGQPERMFTLLLKHRPWIRKESVGRFDLQLSGHTHRGQIWPWNYFVLLQYPYRSGLVDLGEGSSLYTSRGTGTWGPPLRFLSPPEVTIITIQPEVRS